MSGSSQLIIILNYLSLMGLEPSYPYTPQQNDPSLTKSTSSDSHTHYSKCGSLPNPQTAKYSDQTGSYPKTMTSSSPPRLATQQYTSQQPIMCEDAINDQICLTHCSMPPKIPKSQAVADRYYPIHLHQSLPLDYRGKRSSGHLARQVLSEQQNFPERIGPFQQIETISSKSNSSHRSRLYDSNLQESVPQLIGYNHVNNVKPPSFTENAGLMAYMECSQTLDDLFNSQMRINRRSLISSHKGSMQSSIAKGFKKT